MARQSVVIDSAGELRIVLGQLARRLRAEPLRLHQGASCQVAATDSGWKPKIIFNSRA